MREDWAATRPHAPRRSARFDDVDLELADEPEQVCLPRETADDEAQVRGVGRELPERWIHRDPVTEIDFRPGVVVKLSAHQREARSTPRRKPKRARQRDIQLGVLVAVPA